MILFVKRGKAQIINLVEYIESTGTQYIDTGFKPNQNTGVRCSILFTKVQTWRWLFCGRTAGATAAIGLSIPDTTSYIRGEYGNSVFNFSSVSPQSLLDVNFEKNTQTVNEQSNTYNSQAFQSSANMVLFARNTDGTIDAYSSARLYSFKMYDNGVLIRDYLPCKDESGVVCLYDKVNGKYVYNTGSGSFTAGPDL